MNSKNLSQSYQFNKALVYLGSRNLGTVQNLVMPKSTEEYLAETSRDADLYDKRKTRCIYIYFYFI